MTSKTPFCENSIHTLCSMNCLVRTVCAKSPTDIGEMDVSKRMELGSRTIAIFEFLHDKDMFQQVYTILLQQRLLESREVYNVAANLELEHKFLHLLLEVRWFEVERTYLRWHCSVARSVNTWRSCLGSGYYVHQRHAKHD